MSYNSGVMIIVLVISNQPSADRSPDYSLNCTPLGPITITYLIYHLRHLALPQLNSVPAAKESFPRNYSNAKLDLTRNYSNAKLDNLAYIYTNKNEMSQSDKETESTTSLKKMGKSANCATF